MSFAQANLGSRSCASDNDEARLRRPSPRASAVDMSRQRSERSDLTLTTEKVQGPRVWAILTGIDIYKDTARLHSLKGCVNDAEDMHQYLKEKGVPEQNMKLLFNKAATRDAILGSFKQHFLENDDISQEDVVLFFFAGHGARVRVSQVVWQCASNIVGSICPYDEELPGRGDDIGAAVYGIPQPTLQGLFDSLERQKTRNILVILDSCYAGGMFRAFWRGSTQTDGTSTSDSETVRAPKSIPDSKLPTLPDDLDTTVRKASLVPTMLLHNPASCVFGATSEHVYVVLAASSETQPAHEVYDGDTWRGAFTRELTRALRQSEGERNYYAIVSDIKSLILGQNPQCAGTDKYKKPLTHHHVVQQDRLRGRRMLRMDTSVSDTRYHSSLPTPTRRTVAPADKGEEATSWVPEWPDDHHGQEQEEQADGQAEGRAAEGERGAEESGG
ncbi:hypothetical protein DAEQUDRAFT_147237 [Daedalea quercina L-15889]|uniref:Peptidase C14 caspase domain-containing protein n=1 Tax=Daedalea quercina L-15889 TaxID=1314783 RepID=A0A165KNC5_9APHY|nr:hypothetical protein DAEQUDRAFT_147237 [Daedalea quercina L-15889]